MTFLKLNYFAVRSVYNINQIISTRGDLVRNVRAINVAVDCFWGVHAMPNMH